MSQRLNIAYIGAKGFPASAGADHAVEALVRGLAPRHNVTVFCSVCQAAVASALSGVRVVRVPTLPGKHAHATSLFALSALRAFLQGDFDLIHVHNVDACFVLPLLKARHKVIATSQGRAYLLDKWGTVARAFFHAAELAYIRLADVTTAVSRVLARYYTDRYGREVRFIPNGVWLDAAIDPAPAQTLLRAANMRTGDYLMFAAGRLLPSKGLVTLLAAYCALDTELPLLVVGDATQTPGYEAELRRLADQRVRFLPFVDHATLMGLVHDARLFIFPSTIEAMSMMLLEAVSTGSPVIMSNTPENLSVLPEQTLSFRAGDSADLRAKLSWALAHPVEMQDLGLRARSWVRENYAWDTIVLQYEQLYYSLVQRRN